MVAATPWKGMSSAQCYATACAGTLAAANLKVDVIDFEKTLIVARDVAML